MNVIRITPADDRYTIRAALSHTAESRVLLVLPWDVEKGWMHPLDYELLFREAQKRGLEVAWVIDDIARRPLARAAGFPLFRSEEAAQEHLARQGAFPPLRVPPQPVPPHRPWWAETPEQPKPPRQHRQPLGVIILEVGVMGVVLITLIGAAFLSWPSAHVVLVPQGMTYSRTVAVSVDPTLTEVDVQRSLIPARRIGDEFESYVEIGTSGRGFALSGRATGQVLFTNLLGQDYRVPEGTVVRTTSGSYPVRFATTQEVIIPAFGQVMAPIEALEEGPSGNVDPYQINLIEGVVGFAARVTNPDATAGAESTAVATVAEADRERAWNLAAQQVMAEAYNGLQDSAYLEAGEFLPNQALVIQSIPKQAYTHMVGEETPVLGLALRLLVTGQAVNVTNVQAVAYRQLALQLPEGYTLQDARFEYGEAAEEDVGPGLFTFYVTAHGLATAKIDTEKAMHLIRGKPPEEAATLLMESLPLAQPPMISVKPGWFPFLPFLPIRMVIEVIPADWQG
ncbi:MAG TPA: baseplate J/gp47 family protein [Anaerolineae bacterium]|nr:baseplate J/gp47 family protein [Anaerolineae bacterium]HQH39070.1 baseplate J/gp47 family protein [Anaerolineae bacterium]